MIATYILTYDIPSFVLGKLEEIASSSQVHGDGSRGSGLEIRFSASLDNDITLAIAWPPPLASPFYPLFFFFVLLLQHFSNVLSRIFIFIKVGKFIYPRRPKMRALFVAYTFPRLPLLQVAVSRGNLSAHLIGHR